jgi:TRAP-type mannitol/chloroaromatic compound transport system substrate-binding protein
MKRLMAMAGIATAVFATPAAAQEYSFNMATIVPETSFYYQMFTIPFVENVDKLTQGRVKIQPYGGGVLAPALKVHEAVQDGIVELGHATPIYIVNQAVENSLFGAHPGGMDGPALMGWFYEGGGLELLQEQRREKMNLHSLLAGIGPTEVFGHSHIPIRTAEDLKNVKFRAGGAWGNILQDVFGAVPTTVPGSEIYTMLERKAIDIAEFSTIGDNMTFGFEQAAPYTIVPGVHVNAFAFEVVMKPETWDALPDDIKAALEAAAQMTTIQSYLAWTKADLEAVARIEAAGKPEVVRLSDELIDQITVASRDWAMKRAEEEAAKGDDWMRRVTESYYAFADQWSKASAFRP